MTIANEQFKRRATEISRLFFEQNLSKSEISRRKGISVTHVNRILKEAGRLGILKVSVNVPRLHALEEGLREVYQLRDVRVVQASEDRATTRIELAAAAASIFDECVTNGMAVGVSSGRTLFEMATRLLEKPRSIQVLPLNVILDKDVMIHGPSANTVATIAWFRSRPDCRAFHVELFAPSSDHSASERAVNDTLQTPEIRELRGRLGSLDAYFLTTRVIGPESLLSQLSQRRAGGDRELLGRGIVGDVAFNVLDENGTAVQSGLDDLIFKVDLPELKIASASHSKPVVMIGGVDKCGAIRAAARGKLFNTLVTDSDTAEYLLNSRKREAHVEVA